MGEREGIYKLFPSWVQAEPKASAIVSYMDPTSAIVVIDCLVSKPRPALCDSMDCSMPNSTVFHYLLEFAQIHVHWMLSNRFILCHPLLLLPSIFPSIRVFSSESALSIGASASTSVLPKNIQGWFPLGLTGLISLQSKGLFKSLLQHHNLKASILGRSAFFMVQLSDLYMTTGKIQSLSIEYDIGFS